MRYTLFESIEIISIFITYYLTDTTMPDLDKSFISLGETHGDAAVLAYAKKFVAANATNTSAAKGVHTNGTGQSCEDLHNGECGTCRSDVFYPCG
jgi:hypothetical protein